MINLICTDYTLRILISKNENITIDDGKRLISKAIRMVRQNKATSVIVEIKTIRIDKSASDLFNKFSCNTFNFPVILINS